MPQVLDESRETNKKLLEKFKRYSGGKDPAVGFDMGSRYDSVYILKQAIEKVGLDTDKIVEYLYNLKEYCGTIGCYHFDENGDVVGIPYVLFQIKNGKPVKISE